MLNDLVLLSQYHSLAVAAKILCLFSAALSDPIFEGPRDPHEAAAVFGRVSARLSF